MTHHPEASNVLNFNQPDLVYMCRFCSYTSPNVRSLMPHYQRMHPSVKINNAMIFSSYMVDQPHKSAAESQTLREILNSGPKSFSSTSSGSRSSSSPALKSICKTPEANTEAEAFREGVGGNVVVYDCDVCSFSVQHATQYWSIIRKSTPSKRPRTSEYRRPCGSYLLTGTVVKQITYSLTSNPQVFKTSSCLWLAGGRLLLPCKHCVYNNRSVVGGFWSTIKSDIPDQCDGKVHKASTPDPGLLETHG